METTLALPKGQAKFLFSEGDPARLKQWIREHPGIIGFCMVGRSNVGKSSLINCLFGSQTARTSKTPGRTRQVNGFEFHLSVDPTDPNKPLSRFYFFDLPGYGHAEVSKKMFHNWNELMATFFKNMPYSMLVLNIQDARHPDQSVDQDFREYIKQYDNKSFLVLNKIDKLKTQKERAELEKAKPGLYKSYKKVEQIHFVSAESKQGVEQLEQAVLNFMLKHDQLNTNQNPVS